MGQLLDTATIYPHPPQNKAEGARQILEKLIQSHRVSLIVIGNGTAARETELFVSEITKGSDGLNYLITSEAGASVYSASKIARDEFPQLDVSMRGAVSIGRRVQDPLAELVKIDPKAIGVGLYQHDINQSRLAAALDQVVESVVNQVGVEVNTTSAALLTHVAGIGPSLAERIVGYRQKKGAFKNRNQLLDVPGMGLKTYQQSAGFLRIRKGDQPLDKTAIHPESYPLATKILKLLDVSLETSTQDRLKVINKFIQKTDLDGLAKDLNTGQLTLLDIFSEIARPGRDPREDLPKPLLRKDILSMEDLQPGMTLMGTIRNVVDFGAFVDIGVKNDGLLHRSKIKKGSQLKVGDILPVTILAVDQERNRISLNIQKKTTT
jgi:protein Tex